jgi:NAD(P)-dependent dehydrogenase (short-subunit alcohol dehydrogenase family)
VNVQGSILVTGASTGIGEACARELDRLGFRVFAGIRKDADGERLKAGASSRLVPVRIDVSDASQIAAAAKTVSQAVGDAGLAGLVNNAGMVISGPLEVVAIDDLRRQLEINVVGQVAVTQAFLPLVRAARGRIVFMGSVSGRIAPPFLGPYAASKHALEAVADTFRQELRPWGIRVAIVEPGSVQTPIWSKAVSVADQLTTHLPKAAEPLYGETMRTVRAVTEKLGRQGMPVENVVRVVVHALTSPRPKTRYPVGGQTKLAIAAFKFLSDATKDWLIWRELSGK